MFRFILLLTFCVTMAQRTYGKTLFDYNINPKYDLVAEESTSYSNFWPSSDFYVAPVSRHKHHAKKGNNGRGNGKRGRGSPSVHGPYPSYFDSSEEIDDSEELHGYPHHGYHPHGLPPGQAKKHNRPLGHPYEPPRRFPPPPVYDKNFINPWFIPGPTPLPFTVQPPPLITPPVYVAPKFPTRRPTTTTTTTTPAPVRSSTASDDELLYDIDVRFGRD